jgi:hypothetical protein
LRLIRICIVWVSCKAFAFPEYHLRLIPASSGWHFDAEGVSAFRNLRKFTLRAEDDDGFADMGEVRTVLDLNEGSLRHLCLGAYLARHHSWDSAFQSATIGHLTHLDLVDTLISHVVFVRIAHAHNLRSLTLHGTFAEPGSAAVIFGSDHIIDGKHTFLPHLEAFRLVLIGQDHELELFRSVTQFLRQRKGLRRLDLGNCPWDLVLGILPGLTSLRVLRVRVANLDQVSLDALVAAIPKEMSAIHLAAVTSTKPLVRDLAFCLFLTAAHSNILQNGYACFFSSFHSLSLLHFHCASKQRPKQNLMTEKNFLSYTELWMSSARSIASAVPSLDFVGWHGEHYVVVRSPESGSNCGMVDLKELPSKRRLDCGKGVDLGSEEAAWLERKDVPMDYEIPGLES